MCLDYIRYAKKEIMNERPMRHGMSARFWEVCSKFRMKFSKRRDISGYSCILDLGLATRGQQAKLIKVKMKHAVLFRKSEFLLFKVLITNMTHIFFRNKTFLFVV